MSRHLPHGDDSSAVRRHKPIFYQRLNFIKLMISYFFRPYHVHLSDTVHLSPVTAFDFRSSSKQLKMFLSLSIWSLQDRFRYFGSSFLPFNWKMKRKTVGSFETRSAECVLVEARHISERRGCDLQIKLKLLRSKSRKVGRNGTSSLFRRTHRHVTR